MTPEPQVLLAAEESGATLIESAGKTEALALALQAVRKSFGSQIVLNGIDLTVGSGETLAVLGRSGTGKSTSLRLMIGLLKPDCGRVCIGSEDIVHSSEKDLSRVRRHMGFLFQSAALLDSLAWL